MKSKLLSVTILLLIITAFSLELMILHYARGAKDFAKEAEEYSYHRGFADATAAVEDCTVEDAHKNLCTIPCSTDTDCMEKNGSRDNY